MLSKYLSWTKRALLDPAPCPSDTGLFRRLLLKPRLHDLVSAFIQLRDAQRTLALAQSGAPASDGTSNRVAIDDTVQHNLGQVQRKLVVRTRRVEPFYQVLTAPWRDLSNERLLVIGGRNIHELWIASLYGYKWDNIEAIDLFSTNPKIRVMNMEALEYPDATFDAVTMINTLGYSTDPVSVVRGVARVLRPGGRFVFNHVHDPKMDRFGGGDRVPGTDILKALRESGLSVYFYLPSDKINSAGRPQTSHLFGARKPDDKGPPFDPIDF